MSCVMCHVSHVKCHMLLVACCLSSVTCHLSLTPTAKATDLTTPNSYNMHSRLVCKDPKTRKNQKRKKLLKRQKLKKHLEVCQY